MSFDSQVANLKSPAASAHGLSESDIRVVYSPLRISPLGAHVDHRMAWSPA